MIGFTGSFGWEKPAYNVLKRAENLMKLDFGDRVMIWSEMAKILMEKGVPAEYMLGYCRDAFGTMGNCLDLFNVEIKEALTSESGAVMKPEEFDAYVQECPRISMKDHRVLNFDCEQRRTEIRGILLETWDD